METYQQIHDFTAQGFARFVAFLEKHAKPEFRSLEEHNFEFACLGTLEDRLNDGHPLAWELSAHCTLDGKPATFTSEDDDIIVETVTPEE